MLCNIIAQQNTATKSSGHHFTTGHQDLHKCLLTLQHSNAQELSDFIAMLNAVHSQTKPPPKGAKLADHMFMDIELQRGNDETDMARPAIVIKALQDSGALDASYI